MARIEINLDEYNSLKEKILNLEGELVKLSKENEKLSLQNEKYKDVCNYVFSEITSMERIFQWKSILKVVNAELNF